MSILRARTTAQQTLLLSSSITVADVVCICTALHARERESIRTALHGGALIEQQ
jgi:hypothetical protein